MVSLLLASCAWSQDTAKDVSAHANALNIGQSSGPEGADAPIEVPVRFAEDYNFRPRAEIFQLRQNYVKQTPQLLSGDYMPYAKVFGAIESNKPWWGIAGRSVWGPGQRSIEGPSEESRFLSNPYL